MVTGNDDEEVARRALEAGAFDYVCKPFTLEVLARVISAALVLGGRCRWRRGRRWGAPRLLHRWLDTWNGIGLIAGGAHRQDLRLSLSHIRGRVGVGVAPTTPGLKIDAAGRIRLRQAGQASAGLWLHQDTPNDDRAFVGMADDNQVGLYGKGIGWGLAMDINSGNVTIKGRCSNSNIRTAVMKNNKVDITTAAWAAMPDMSLTFVAAIPNSHFHITAFINGVQSNTPNVGPVQNLAAEFRLLLDGGVVDFTRHEFHQSGWELRGVFLSRLLPLNAGQHTVAVHWRSAQGQNTSACWYGDTRQIQVIEL